MPEEIAHEFITSERHICAKRVCFALVEQRELHYATAMKFIYFEFKENRPLKSIPLGLHVADQIAYCAFGHSHMDIEHD